MAIYAIRKGDESADRIQNRFKSQVQNSRLVKLLRERRRFKKKPTKRLQRLRALKREGFRKENKKKQFYSNM
jgi:ribosomal protein S21